MLDIQKQHSEFRLTVKTAICQLLVDLYLQQYGQLPNQEDEEEIVIDDKNIQTYRILVECGDTYSNDNSTFEKWAINEYRVTLDENLFFRCGDGNDEIHWDEISTDELVDIWTLLKKSIKQ